MFSRRLIGLVAGIAALVAVSLATDMLDVDVRWRGHDAGAADLFGRGESRSATPEVSAAADPFWSESSGGATIPGSIAPNTFSDLAEKASPAVVNIQTSHTVSGTPFGLPPGFEDFFNGMPDDQPRGPDRKVPSLGTGFVISSDGYIVTNNHVVEASDSIKVAFLDGSELDAEVVGRDPKTDVALIRVKADRPLAALSLGDSDGVRPGDWVVAIGNPFGLGHTVTAGIVSAKSRRIGQGPYDDFIQTDAAINPGNSGGPLINLAGEVIGINTAIRPMANTIGFSVAINVAKEILPQLKSNGKVRRGWLGVAIQPLTRGLQESFNLDDRAGALVAKVEPGSPAADAGLSRGDVIVEFDGHPVKEMEALPRLVGVTPIGKTCEVVVLREGKRKTFEVKVSELADASASGGSGSRDEKSGPTSWGMRIGDLTPDLARQLELEDQRGAVILQIKPGSAAEEAELRRGDVILEVNGREIANAADLTRALGDSDKGVRLLVRRGKSEIYVALKKPTE